jgi:gluconokinase
MSSNQNQSSHPCGNKEKQKPLIVILMGVSGVGKTTIGSLLAEQLTWPFYDADSFHSPENIAKMQQGIPLTDESRQTWLEAIRQIVETHLQLKKPAIIACSALKNAYRNILKAEGERICFVYLKGPSKLIRKRLQRRSNHFMKDTLLESQFDTLEDPEPESAITIDVSGKIEQTVRHLASLFAD